MICVPIVAPSQERMEREIQFATPLADILELRMDYAPDADLAALIEKRRKPVIVTCRPEREGGQFKGEESARLAVLQRAIDLGADYVDVELDSAAKLRRGARTRIIISRHDFQRVPENLPELHRELVAAGADVAKIACMATGILDNLRVFRLLQSTKHPTIALCMGEAGMISRVLGRKYGAFLTFGSAARGKESAPGQIGAAQLRDMYRYKQIGRATALYGVIANPVAHSMSPAIHNAAFAALNIDAVYLPLKVECDPAEFVRAFRELDARGYSVTIPHKEGIIPALDELAPLAKRIGAVNTVVERKGRLHGTNTDVPAAIGALEESLAGGKKAAEALDRSPLSGRRVLLLGAGGAARAVAHGLIEKGAGVVIANRTHDRAVALAAEVGCRALEMTALTASEADIVVNTTSVGMHPNVHGTPLPKEALRKGMIVFDAVYNPLETRLLREAREAGCRTIGGLRWFVSQAALQFELWTGRPAPRQVMEKVVKQRLEEK
jgi:3-dehydroquinate dehydratase/shikimate dehydrogenase